MYKAKSEEEEEAEERPMLAKMMITEAEVSQSMKRARIEQEESGETCGRVGDNNVTLTMKLPTKLLDCAVCSKPLQPPMFQCIEHIICSKCNDISDKCPVCKYYMLELRCPVLDSIISTIKCPCTYASFGCWESVFYSLKDTHEASCPFRPCFCPFENCDFQGFTKELIAHIRIRHRLTKLISFCYNISSKTSISRQEPFRVLYGKDDHLFLLLNGQKISSGNALSMVCVRTVTTDFDFQYELKVKIDKENSIEMKATLQSIRDWKGSYPTKQFLFVPSELTGKSKSIDVRFRIIRKTK